MNSNTSLARVAGFLYLIMIVSGGFAKVFVRGELTVSGDAAATAHNILASEPMYRFGFVADLVCLVCGTFLSLIFYILFKPVNRGISLLALIFSITAGAVMAVNLLNQLAPLLLLHKTVYQVTFSAGQLETLSLFFSICNHRDIISAFSFLPFIFQLSGTLFISQIFCPGV